MNEILIEFAAPLTIGFLAYTVISYWRYRKKVRASIATRKAAMEAQKQPGQPYAGQDTIKREDRIHKLDDTLADPRYDG